MCPGGASRTGTNEGGLGFLYRLCRAIPYLSEALKTARKPIVRYERNGDVDEIFETAKEKMRKLGTKYGIKLYVSEFRLVLNDRFSFGILDLWLVGEE